MRFTVIPCISTVVIVVPIGGHANLFCQNDLLTVLSRLQYFMTVFHNQRTSAIRQVLGFNQQLVE